MINIKSVPLLAVVPVFLALMIPGCGSGGGGGGLAGGGIGGTGITSGTVTGFGSVFVNGIEFETGTGTSYDVDDDPGAVESDLGIGMVVTVVGTVNDDGVTGTADSIEYDEEVEGPITDTPVEDVDAGTMTFDVFDVTVVADSTTIFVGTTYDSLAKGDIVEVSGFFDESGNLAATRLEDEGGTTGVEVKGTVECGGAVDCDGSFTLGSLSVTYDVFAALTDLTEVPDGVVADGQFVEVKGVLTPPASIAATRIELEDEGFGDNVEQISIEGIVTEFNNIGDFMVGAQRVNASGAIFMPASLDATLGVGGKVEVEGAIVAGVLQAVEVEQRGGELDIAGVVSGSPVTSDGINGTVMVEVVSDQLLAIHVNSQTQLDDERDGMDDCTLSSIDDRVELDIRAYLDTDDIVAVQIKCDDLEKFELKGPYDPGLAGGDSTSGSVTILGITILTDNATDFEINDGSKSGNEYYTQDGACVVAEFEDGKTAEVNAVGIADKVECDS